LTDRTIADYLRGATSEGVIEGWYHTGPLAANDWVVNSRLTGAQQYSRAEIIGYVSMLKEAGLDPRPIKWPK